MMAARAYRIDHSGRTELFLRRDAMCSTDYAVACRKMSVRLSVPSVRPSHAGIVSKRLNNPRTFFTIGWPNHSSLPVSNVMAILQQGPPKGDTECREYKKIVIWTHISLCVGNGTR